MKEETTAEFAASALLEAPVLKARASVTVAAKTDLGRVRENNEDKHEFYLPEDDAVLATRGQIFLVCDGMGGHAAGQIASELTCKTFIDVYLSHPSADPIAAMKAAVKAANRFVLDVAQAVPSRRGMGTTLSALILLQGKAYTVQVGDSRVYRLRGDAYAQLTSDHGWVEEAVARGEIPPEAAADHPYKHVLTRAVGTEDSVECDVTEFDVESGDIFLLCSDGLSNHVRDEEMAQALIDYAPGEAVWRLVGKALVDGGSDNCTAMVVRVDQMEAV